MKILTALIFFIIPQAVILSTALAMVEAPKNPKSAKGCAICHYRWIDTFFIEGKGSDLVDYQAEKVVASPGMCFSCHDGSVRDSRSMMIVGSGHKTGVAPPEHMKIPEVFPLDEHGKIQCSTCHTAHGVPSGEGVECTIFMRASNNASAMCRACHPQKDRTAGMGDHPMGTVKRPVSPKLVARGALAGKQGDRILCQTCHAAHGSPFERFLIDSAGDSALCLDCHADKSIFTADGNKNSSHVINVVPKKVNIPGHLVSRGARLGYNGAITCQTCHKIHENRAGAASLLVEKNEKSSLCLVCHSEKRSLENSKHNLIRSAPGEKNLQGRTAAEAGMCSACHLPHEPARNRNGEKDFSTSMCLSCHSRGMVAEKVVIAGNSHPLGVSPFDRKAVDGALKSVDFGDRPMSLPLFNDLGVEDKNGKMTCATCHEPHAASKKPESGSGGKSSGQEPSSHLLRAQPPHICGECHHSKLLVAGSKHDLARVVPESKNILGQTPAQAGVCGSCHAVHGGGDGFLWARETVAGDEASPPGMCVSCHNEKGVAFKKAVGGFSHPTGVSPVKKGLTTTLPLFGRDGKTAEDGLMSCRTCHDPHRWDPVETAGGPHFYTEGTARNSFLRLENSPAPKLCENCHADKAFVEKTDHDLTLTAPSALNAAGQTPAESGVCGVCHQAHNSKNRTALWAQNFAGGDSMMEKICYSCHSENGCADNKVPKVSWHPKDKLVINAGRNVKFRDDFFPIFDDVSGDLLPVGNISCPSCHNAHQWHWKTKSKGKGVNLEGNATNSFLRSRAMQKLCIDCHGPEALVKIKFYHDPNKRNHKPFEILRR